MKEQGTGGVSGSIEIDDDDERKPEELDGVEEVDEKDLESLSHDAVPSDTGSRLTAASPNEEGDFPEDVLKDAALIAADEALD